LLTECSGAAAVSDWLQYQSSASLYAINDSSTISCTLPVFPVNDVIPFLGIQEWKMIGIPGRLGNGRPGMQTLFKTVINACCMIKTVIAQQAY